MSDFGISGEEYYISDADGREVCIDISRTSHQWQVDISVPMVWPDGQRRKQRLFYTHGATAEEAALAGMRAARRVLNERHIWERRYDA
jgi:type 1 glutamine amidotransferase